MNNDKKTVNAASCVGCGACVISCPKGCISLKRDADGFLKCSVQTEACVLCGKCLQICPISEATIKKSLKTDKSFVAYCKDTENAFESTSGGIGHVLAAAAIENGYTVVGADWDLENHGVKHICVNDVSELDRLRKSKYVQSYTPDAFSKIADLEKVMVFGTPCQIAGLRKAYPHKENWVLVDFDCMGPAGKNLLDKYLIYLNGKNTSGVSRITMREKRKGWMNYGIRVNFQDGSEYYQDKYRDPFCQCFNFARLIQDYCARDCVFHIHSEADIRIGDAWNYLDDYPYSVAKHGLSLVSVQTPVGELWLNRTLSLVNMVSVERQTPCLSQVQNHPNLTVMLREPDVSIEDVVKKYKHRTRLARIKDELARLLSQNYYIYRTIRSLLHKRSKK